MLTVFFALLDNPADEPLFEEFYNNYNRMAYNVSMIILQNHHYAEDCVQEVFLNLAKNFESIKPNLNSNDVEHLVKVAAKNMSVDVYRKNRRHTNNVIDSELLDYFAIVEGEFEICEKIDIRDALDSLPEEIKNIFYMKYVCGESGARIAEFLGISEPLVRKRCMKGRDMMKKFLDEKYSNDY